MDFGIVKSKNQQHQATQTGELKGKLSYLAPELIRGKAVDRRADIFTLGVVLYVITVGRGPFNPSSGQDAGQTLLRILDGEYAAPASIVPDYPPELEAIVRRALAPRVDDRYGTADEMRLALEDFLANGSRPVTRDDVAALLAHHCGQAIDQRRQEIRSAQRLFDSQAGQARSGTFPAGETTGALSLPGMPTLEMDPSSRSGRTLASESQEPAQAPSARAVAGKSRRPLMVAAGSLAVALVGAALWLLPQRAPEPANRDSARVAARPVPSQAALDTALPARAAPEAQVPSPASEGALASPATSVPAVPAAAAPRASRRGSARELVRVAGGTESESVPAAAVEPRSPADSNAFSQPVSRKPARHAIDESDPFGK